MTTAMDERRLITIFVAAGHGTADETESALRTALDKGVEPSLIEETLLLLIPYAGIPRSLLAFGAWRKITPTRSARVMGRPDGDGGRGRRAFESVYGPATQQVLDILHGLHPDLLDAAVEDAYGRILARESFPWSLKELLAVAFLIRLSALPQAQAHARAAMAHGASASSLELALELGSEALGEDARRNSELAIAAVLRSRRTP